MLTTTMLTLASEHTPNDKANMAMLSRYYDYIVYIFVLRISMLKLAN